MTHPPIYAKISYIAYILIGAYKVYYNIWNRRYTGSKYKLSEWITDLINNNCKGNSFCDIFAGTGIISYAMLNRVDYLYINDFLYSNEIIYKAFFDNSPYNIEKLDKIKSNYDRLNILDLPDNYCSQWFGNKFFSYNDAKLIGHIRESIDLLKNEINEKEKNILIASLIYSADKSANTVGHYDAYIKGKELEDKFSFELIKPYCTTGKNILISRKDANEFARELECDVVYIDPPYNSRQYSRFYHVLENIACWEKPELYGEALKPIPKNMSDYCRSNATSVFADLINNLNCKYIVVSYNNTYNSKSSSSKNKITLDEILTILNSKGRVKTFEKSHQYFNAGKTNFSDHKEFIFIVEVGDKNDKNC